MRFRLSVETYQGKSSRAARQETHSHDRLSSLSHCGQILALKKNKQEWNWCVWAGLHFVNTQAGEGDVKPSPQILEKQGKSPHHQALSYYSEKCVMSDNDV